MLRLTMLGSRNVFLVGPMGSGKTAVGRQLARQLRAPFFDTDAEIERDTGVDIPYIFECEGEPGFRDREVAVIDALTCREGIVLATGGGAVLRPENRRHLAERGCVVYLETSVAQQAGRVGRSCQRPLLRNVDPVRKLEQLMAERAPLYREIADLIVGTDGRSVRVVADDILRELRSREPLSQP